MRTGEKNGERRTGEEGKCEEESVRREGGERTDGEYGVRRTGRRVKRMK